MLGIFSKRHTVQAIVDRLNTLNAIAHKTEDEIRKNDDPYLPPKMYNMSVDGEVGKLFDNRDFVEYLHKNMNYRKNEFSDREIFEIFISFKRPRLMYEYDASHILKSFAQKVSAYDTVTPRNLQRSISSAKRTVKTNMWEKKNYAQVLLENCERKDFLRLLTSYNSHEKVAIKPLGKDKNCTLNIVSSNIEKGSELEKYCVEYFFNEIGFSIGLNISAVGHKIYDDNWRGGIFYNYTKNDRVISENFKH